MTAVGSWGYYIQGNGHQKEIDEAGSQLSIQLNCPVHYPAYNKRLFECRCGVLFPVFLADYAIMSGDWSVVLKHHRDGDRQTEKMY